MSTLYERCIQRLTEYFVAEKSDCLGPAKPELFARVEKVLQADRELTYGNGPGPQENMVIALANEVRSECASGRSPTSDVPVNWEALKRKTVRAGKQFELIRLLYDTGDWVAFAELADLIYQDETTPTPTIAQLIKRANESLAVINARVHIRRDGERAIADIL